MRWIILFSLLLPSTLAADVTGPARVIDGDTVQIGGTTLRLHGIDAPEAAQTCTDRDGAPWPCGAWVTAQVAALLEGAELACTTLEVDRHGRDVARCLLDGDDLGEMLVAAGLATAYREYSWDYDLTEKGAQIAGLGIWSGGMQSPAAFRAGQRPPGTPPPGDCAIKGNISGAGRIYHVPGQENYDDTRISPDRGEQWFCTPAEAEAAGWRPARR